MSAEISATKPIASKRRAEDIPLSRRTAAFAFFMFADFFYGWSWNTVDLLRPDIRESLGLTLTQAGSMYSAQAAGALVGAIIIGQLADRLGRRNALIGIMLGYGISLLVGAFVNSYEQVLAQRFVLGLFLGGIFPTIVGLYTGLFDRSVCGRLAGFYNGTFNASVVALGLVASQFTGLDWRGLLIVGAIPPILAAPLALLFVPNDRTTISYGQTGPVIAATKLPVVELFTKALRRRTGLLAVMVGLNFFGYQAFAGWQTTYLKDVRGIDEATRLSLVGWQFAATIVGGFAWGWIADRFGRKVNAVGFLGASALIVVYLTLATTPLLLGLVGMVFGFFLASSVIWGPWIAELYPVHLRSTAASIFNWGRIISFFAPLVTGAIAERFGLTYAMFSGAAAFTLAALIWLKLPETLDRSVPGTEPAELQ